MQRKVIHVVEIIAAVCLLVFSGVEKASGEATWNPVIGIPDPPFGISEVAPPLPNPWTSNVSGFYYVQAGGGNSGNGYPGSPRATIPTTLSAGSVVILAGTYDKNHENDPIAMYGTASQPVFIRGTSDAVRPTITMKWVVGGSYFILEYLNARWANSSGNGKLEFLGDHGVVRHSDFRGDTGNGIGGVYPAGTYHVIWNNYLHDFGDVTAATDQDNHGISIGANTNNIWIISNEIARMSGDGVQINAGDLSSQASTHHIYVGRNNSHHNKQTGAWSKQAVDVIFSGNQFHGHRAGNSSAGDGTGGQYGPSYLWIIFNDIYDNEGGVKIASGSGLGNGTDVFIIGNKIHNIHKQSAYNEDSWEVAAAAIWYSVNTYVIGNTMWDIDAGINSPASGKVDIVNNIIDSPRASAGNTIWLYEAAQASASAMDYNLLKNSVRIRWGDSVRRNLSNFQSTFSKGSHSISTDDPKFINAGTSDFSLQADSPALDKGVQHSVYATFLNRYGLNIAKDIAGASRPQGAGWDIGAYEGAGTLPPPPPPPPPPRRPNPPTILEVK